MTLTESARIAQESGQFDSMPITLITRDGREIKAQWGDAYLGVITYKDIGIIWQDTAESLGWTVK